jgi:SAM-dependent methyltransferase
VSDPRDEYIGKVVRGKSFADVGGLWGTVNEKVSVAYRCGARSLTMIDISPPKHELWRLFEDRRQTLGLPEVSCSSGDILALADTFPCPQFDVVHCSGVLYHMPDPMRLLMALRKITREYLVLTSAVTATRVKSDQGALEIPRAAALFIPALQGQERAILRSYWQRFVGEGAVGLTCEAASWQPDDFAPWWWLPTVAALKAMCAAAGFHCQEGARFWNDNAYVQLLSVRT